MVLATLSSFIRCAHCSERGLCAKAVARGCDVESIDGAIVTVSHLDPCDHITAQRFDSSVVFAETSDTVRTLVLQKLGDPVEEDPTFLYAVPLEAAAVYHVCEDPREDYVIFGERRMGGRTHAVLSLRLVPECGGFLVREVAFERRRGSPPALAIVLTHTGPADVVGRANVFKGRPLCYASVVSPQLRLEPCGDSTPELEKIAVSFFRSGGMLVLSVDGKRMEVHLPTVSDLPAGARVWLTDIGARVAAAYIVSKAQSFAALNAKSLGWRVEQSHWE